MGAGDCDVHIINSREYLNNNNKIETPARIMINFDDSPDSTYTIAYPILAANGQVSAVFPRLDWLGLTNQMTQSNLEELYNAGWDIGNHGYNHATSWAAKTISDMKADVDYGDNYLKQYFPKSAKFVAYPYGSYNQNIIDYIKTKGCKMARTTNGAIHNNQIIFDGDAEFKINCYSIADTTDTDTVKGYITAAVAASGLCVLLFHRIVAADAGDGEYLTADFQDISDYLKTWEASGSLVVTNYSRYYQDYVGNDLTMEISGARVTANDVHLLCSGKGNQVYYTHIEEAP